MNYEQSLEYIHSVDWKGSRLGLERITKLMSYLGNPQKKLRIIHVAGTNGKGSFCAMLSEVLINAGYKVGTFTSPYIEFFNERIMYCGKMIDDNDLAHYTTLVKEQAEKLEDKPTEFELITAIGFLYFSEHDCDFVVCEVGMGGRLDSTNIIENPVLSVITGIALDHTAILGDTPEKIAFEKAGIIKQNCPVLLGSATAPEHFEGVYEVVRKKSEEMNAAFYNVDVKDIRVRLSSVRGSVIDYNKHRNVKVSIPGMYQPRNAAAVIKASEILNGLGIKISEMALRKGLRKTYWKARFEVLSKRPLCIFDGSHNPQGIAASLESIRTYFPRKKIVLVSGVLADKNHGAMADSLAPVLENVYTVRPDNPRALDAGSYAEEFESRGVNAEACESFESAIEKAFDHAMKKRLPVFVLGSLYIYSDVKQAIIKYKNK